MEQYNFDSLYEKINNLVSTENDIYDQLMNMNYKTHIEMYNSKVRDYTVYLIHIDTILETLIKIINIEAQNDESIELAISHCESIKEIIFGVEDLLYERLNDITVKQRVSIAHPYSLEQCKLLIELKKNSFDLYRIFNKLKKRQKFTKLQFNLMMDNIIVKSYALKLDKMTDDFSELNKNDIENFISYNKAILKISCKQAKQIILVNIIRRDSFINILNLIYHYIAITIQRYVFNIKFLELKR